MKKIIIEYFHDVLWAHCYTFSPRLRKLVEEFPQIEVINRAFALSRSYNHAANVFGSQENVKKVILNHWREARRNDDDHRINVELMEGRDFNYPYSIPGLLGCKAAEIQGGQKAHWNYFDLVQKAHLTEARNIADEEVLYDVAAEAGLDREKFIKDFNSEAVKKMVEEDIELAKQYMVNSVPTIIVNYKEKISGALKYDQLKELIIKNYM